MGFAEEQRTILELTQRVGQPPNDMRFLTSYAVAPTKVALKFLEPLDSYDAVGNFLQKTGGVKIVMSTDHYPTSIADGEIVCDNTDLGAYETTPFIVEGLIEGQTYYFTAFPYSVKGVLNYTNADANHTTITPLNGEYAEVVITVDNDVDFESVTVTCVDETNPVATHPVVLTAQDTTYTFMIERGHNYHIEYGDADKYVTPTRSATRKAVNGVTTPYTGAYAYFDATINVTFPAGATVTCSNGTVTLTGSTTGTFAFHVHYLGHWTITATNGEDEAVQVVNVTANGQTLSATLKFSEIYGAQWDGTSTTRWSRTDLAETFTDPVPYMSGVSNYGSPFDNISPWKDMVKSERTGGTMVAIPKFWYKLTKNGNGLKVQISPKAEAGFSVSPAHMNRGDGKGERDVIYVGRYHCHTSDYKSKTGGKPKASITRSAARTAIHNLGTNIWQMDFATRFTLWLLYIVEFADWNSQAKIGYGCGNNSATENMGYTDSMPYHTGTTKSSRTTYGVSTQYRNIEGLWDNVLDWCDGCYYNSNGMNIIKNPSQFSDSANGTLIGKPSSGYPSAFNVSSDAGFPMFFPTAASGSETTYSCDYWDFGGSGPCLYVGGSYGQSGNRGLFCVSYGSASNSYGYIGSRLMELP